MLPPLLLPQLLGPKSLLAKSVAASKKGPGSGVECGDAKRPLRSEPKRPEGIVSAIKSILLIINALTNEEVLATIVKSEKYEIAVTLLLVRS